MSTAPVVPTGNFWTLDRVADALAPLARWNLPRGDARFGRVWTDTRTIQAGDLFVALAGERFDAHDFLADAVAKGATGVVVSSVQGTAHLGVPVFEVSDTLVALGALGTYRRRAWGGSGRPVVAIVGSNGKTSTKELARAALSAMFEVHGTTGNLNNLVGVPLTLLAISDTADVAVVEMGTNQPGEVPRLRQIVEPDITVVTSVAEEHLEGFGDLHGVMREEMAATDGIRVAIVPAAQPEVVEEATRRAKRVVSAGVDAGDVRPGAWGVGDDGRGWIELDAVRIELPVRGVHNVRNALLALAVARELGVATADAARGIAGMTPPPMRVAWERHGAATIVNDAYNSNPGSARAAIELLQRSGQGQQRVAILGTMLELGAQTARLHDDVATQALASGIEVIAGLGEFAAALGRVAPGDARVVTADDVESLWARLSSRLSPDAIILLKGSRGMRLERLVTPIAEWAARAAPV